MTKIVAIGDIHGRSIWKDIVKKEKPDKVIFMGDYFDSYDLSADKQQDNFKSILQFKEDDNGIEVIMLYGNHEHHYIRDNEFYSGYQENEAGNINKLLNYARTKGLIKIAHIEDNFLFTHAGVSEEWRKLHLLGMPLETIDENINRLFLDNEEIWRFDFAGFDPHGNSREASPIWIRHGALLKANKKSELKKKYTQVVGHTEMPDLNLDIYKKWLGDRYIPIDALNQKQYLIIENNQPRTGKIGD